MRKLLKVVGIAFAVLLAIAFVFAMLNGGLLFEVPWVLATGWVPFLRASAGRITVDRGSLALAAGCAALLAVSGHLFARAVFRRFTADATRAWPWRFTLSGLALLVVMFAACIATLAVVHQTGWLFSSGEPFAVSSWADLPWESGARGLCGSLHSGREPAATLVAEQERFRVLTRGSGANAEYLFVPIDPVDRSGFTYTCRQGKEERVAPELVTTTLAGFLEPPAAARAGARP